MIGAEELSFSLVDADVAMPFVKRHHYSHSCPPSQMYFGAFFQDALVGVAVFRKPSLPRVSKGYGVDLELVRLVLIDEAGKNSESRFVMYCIRHIRSLRRFGAIISYADPRFGHSGTVYRACSFPLSAKKGGMAPGASSWTAKSGTQSLLTISGGAAEADWSRCSLLPR